MLMLGAVATLVTLGFSLVWICDLFLFPCHGQWLTQNLSVALAASSYKHKEMFKPSVPSASSWSIRMQSFGSLKGIYDMTEIARIIQTEIERETY